MSLSRRYVQSAQPAEVPCYSTFTSLPPAGLEEPNQVELLLMENERLRQELEAHREKTSRIQKVRGANPREEMLFLCSRHLSQVLLKEQEHPSFQRTH